MKFLILILLASTANAIVFQSSKKLSTTAEKQKIQKAALKVNETLGSQCFYDFMTKRDLLSTNGRTPVQVVEHLRSLNQSVEVKMYTRCMKFGFRCPKPTSAVAFRQPPEMIINLNRVAFTLKDSDCAWASTMAHEGLGHALGGYGHTFEWTAKRDFTVPYSLGGSSQKNGGDAFTNCCK